MRTARTLFVVVLGLAACEMDGAGSVGDGGPPPGPAPARGGTRPGEPGAGGASGATGGTGGSGTAGAGGSAAGAGGSAAGAGGSAAGSGGGAGSSITTGGAGGASGGSGGTGGSGSGGRGGSAGTGDGGAVEARPDLPVDRTPDLPVDRTPDLPPDTSGRCDPGGVCETINRDYVQALARAQACQPRLEGQCQARAHEGLLCPGCEVWVNTRAELDPLVKRWADEGCTACRATCSLRPCRALVRGACTAAGGPPDRIIAPPQGRYACTEANLTTQN